MDWGSLLNCWLLFFFQAQTLGREPTCEELFKDTHCKVKDKTFVDKKSAKKYVSLPARLI